MSFLPHPPGLKKRNLKRMADYIETIPKEAFSMRNWRSGQLETPECDSVGCIIGHCTVLAPKLVERCSNLIGWIDFEFFSAKFTGLDPDGSHWAYLFGAHWREYDDTPTGAAQRIRYYLKHGLPIDTYKDRLAYKNEAL